MSSPDPNSFQAQYNAFTDGWGFVMLEDWSSVDLVGDDRASFLHNMCSNDIRKLAAGAGCEAFCTNVQGKVLAHVFVIAMEDRLELLTVPGQSRAIIGHLDRYIIREDVQLEDSTAAVGWIVLSGAKTSALLDGCVQDASSQLQRPWSSLPCRFGDVDCLVVRSELVWTNHFLLRYEINETAQLCQWLTDAGAVACGSDTWTAVRVESGLPLFEVDFDSSNLPQEVNRDDRAISFNKGCYLGQETVARIDALGHVNKQLVQVQFAGKGVPSPGTALTAAEQNVGEVTTACWSPRWKSPLALAMVRRGWNDPGSQFESEFGPATVVPAH